MFPGAPKLPGEDFINSFYPILLAVVLGLVFGFRNYMRGPKCPSEARMNGKIVVVTGANSGIGYETAKSLAFRGAEVILACRNEVEAEAAIDKIKKSLGIACNLTAMKLDLALMKSVEEFAQSFNARYAHLDVLVNNAGVMCHPQARTTDDYELHFQTNYLVAGHFMLTQLLLNKLKASPGGARIVNVIANAYRLGEINFDDIHFESRQFVAGDAYSQSKLATVLFTHKLAKFLKDSKVTVLGVNPGVVRTDAHRHMPFRQNALFSITLSPVIWFLMKTAYDGAQTVIYCAVASEVANASGSCYSDCQKMTIEANGCDDDVADRLWNLSFQLCHIRVHTQ